MFRNIIEKISENPGKLLAIVMILTVLLAYSASTMESEETSSFEDAIPSHPKIKSMNRISEDFGSEEPVMILVEDKDVLTPKTFEITTNILEKLWENEKIKSALTEPKGESMNSIPTTLASYRLRYEKEITRPTQEQVFKEARNFPSSEEIKKTLRAFENDPRISRNLKEYTFFMFPKNFNPSNLKNVRKMNAFISLDAGLSTQKLKTAELHIENIVEGYSSDTEMSVFGETLMGHYATEAQSQTEIMFLIAFILVLAMMALNYRRFGDVAISALGLLLIVVWTLGFAGLFNFSLSLAVSMTPTLIIGLGIDFSFHTIMGYRERLPDKNSKRGVKKAGAKVLIAVGAALGLATVTTAFGFMSNTISDIQMMTEFAITAGLGVFSAFLVNVLFVLPLREYLDLRTVDKGDDLSGRISKERIGGKAGRVLGSLMKIVRNPYVVLFLAFLVAFSGLWVGTGMKASYNYKNELPRNSDIAETFTKLNEEFQVGTERAYIRVNGDLSDPDLWRNVSRAVQNMDDDEYVVSQDGKAQANWLFSLAYEVSMTNENLMKLYRKVDSDTNRVVDRDVTEKEMTEFLNRMYQVPTLRGYLHKSETGGFNSLLVTALTETEMGFHGSELTKELKEDFEVVEAEVEITGTPIVYSILSGEIRDAMIYSVALVLVFAFVLLMIVFRWKEKSLSLGFLTALIPMTAIGWLFFTMHVLNIPLNAMTAMVGAIVVGLGVDYPIHIANRWSIERRDGKDWIKCYLISLRTTGKEVFYSAITMGVAFASFIIVPIPIITQFGLVMLFGILYSIVAATVFLPALLKIWHENL